VSGATAKFSLLFITPGEHADKSFVTDATRLGRHLFRRVLCPYLKHNEGLSRTIFPGKDGREIKTARLLRIVSRALRASGGVLSTSASLSESKDIDRKRFVFAMESIVDDSSELSN
jgi:hypothetical protein